MYQFLLILKLFSKSYNKKFQGSGFLEHSVVLLIAAGVGHSLSTRIQLYCRCSWWSDSVAVLQSDALNRLWVHLTAAHADCVIELSACLSVVAEVFSLSHGDWSSVGEAMYSERALMKDKYSDHDIFICTKDSVIIIIIIFSISPAEVKLRPFNVYCIN